MDCGHLGRLDDGLHGERARQGEGAKDANKEAGADDHFVEE